MNFNDTIVAAATPYGYGGLSVVRLSGNDAKNIAQNICRRDTPLKDRRATMVTLYTSNNEPFDGAVVTVFKTPNSYTGEDVVEFSCHGSPTIVEQIIELSIDLGARTADPGEFTRRAFINSKIDLVQAESVAAVIHSQGEKSVQMSHRVLSGELSNKLNDIKQTIVEALSYVEFELDISEDELIPDSVVRVQKNISYAFDSISALTESFSEGRLLNRGASVVITGPPNAGKSTLFNALLNENKAIINPAPGTTRDTIEAGVIYDGISVVYSDTAGIRKSNEDIETEGIRRAEEKIKNADLVLSIFDIENFAHFNNNNKNGAFIPVLNKCDLYDQQQISKVKSGIDRCICISAKTGLGINEVKAAVKNNLRTSASVSDVVFLITQRQYDVASSCLGALERSLQLMKNGVVSFELLSIELREALDAVDKILGKTTSEDILNNIFSNFCVGK